MTHPENISNFLSTKEKDKVYFGGRDIYINPKGHPSSRKNNILRRSLAQWIYRQLKKDNLVIGEFKIKVHTTGNPYVYIATRQA